MRVRRHGFTVVEVLVALTILATSVLLVTRTFLVLLEVTMRSGSRTVATALAVRVLEEVRSGPESQGTAERWASRFDAIATQMPAGFPAPYGGYEYQVQVNQVATDPGSPVWLTEPPMHPDSLKWVTVRVSFKGRPLAQVSSAVIREMYRRP